MAETVRDVVVRVSIQMAAARLQVPDTSAFTAAVSTAMANTGQSVSTPIVSATKAVEQSVAQMGAAFTSLDATQQAAVKDQLTAKAEQLANQQAAAVEAAARREQNALKQTDAARSAVLAGYGMMATSAFQAAKGIAFVTAANQEQAEAMVRTVAAAQGYFDLLVGGLHIVKGLNDVQRQSVIFLNLQAAAQATVTATAVPAAAATTGLAVAETGVAVASVPAAAGLAAVAAAAWLVMVPLLPLVAAGAAVAAGLYGLYRAGSYAFAEGPANELKSRAKALHDLSEAAGNASDSLSRMNQVTLAQSKNTTTNIIEPGQVDQMEREIARIQAAREKNAISQKRLATEANAREVAIATRPTFSSDIAATGSRIAAYATGGFAGDTDAARDKARQEKELDYQREVQANAERAKRAQEEDNALAAQQLEIQKQIIGSKQAEYDNAMKLRESALQTLQTEQARNQSENVRLGLMSRADQNRAKRLLDKVGRGEELTYHEAQQANSLGIAKPAVEATARREAERLGLTQSREAAGETKPLKEAQKAVDELKPLTELANELATEIKEAKEKNKAAFEVLGNAIVAAMNQQGMIDELTKKVKKLEDAQQKGGASPRGG